ncbi:MAG: Gldg family protein [Calditrichia bacterium]
MKRYANIALIVGILMFAYSFVNFSLNQIWDWISTISLILGLILGGVGAYYRIQLRQKKLNRRSLQYGANTVVSAVLVLGIVVFLAFISNRHSARADMTAKGLFSLAEQTKSVLNDMKKDVKIYAFYKQSDETMAKDLLEEYSYRSKFVKYEFVDPNQQPQIARQYDVKQYNTVVVTCGNKKETLTELNESNLTNALIKVTRELDKTIYFTVGHGERQIEDEGAQGYKTAADGIKKENYAVKTINLAQEKSIPQDCSVLVIAGPKSDFFPFELDSIKSYVNSGGKLFVMVDPQNWKPGLAAFLKEYKVEIGDNIIVDASGVGQLFGMGPEVPLVSKYEDSDVFKDFSVMTFYPLACSVQAGTEGGSGFTTRVLFRSSPSSWAEADYMNKNVEYNSDRDVKGPVSMAVVASKTLDNKKKAAIMVIGDSDFANNSYIRNSGNYDVFLNEVNWMAEEQDMITIRPKEFDDQRVTLTAKQSKIVLYLSVIALPLIVIIAGVSIYYKRR